LCCVVEKLKQFESLYDVLGLEGGGLQRREKNNDALKKFLKGKWGG